MLIQYHGNDLNALRQRACSVLAADPPPPLVEELVVVPNAGMGRWLRQGIAAQLGVVVGVSCVSPAAFTARLAERLLPGQAAAREDPWAKEALVWALMGTLPPLLDAPDFAPLRQYLGANPDQVRVFGLCQRLAELFDQYLYFRPDWLLAWERGETDEPADRDGQRWQLVLWRALVTSIRERQPAAAHGAERAERLSAALGQGRGDDGLPPRVIVFGLTAMSPVLLALLVRLSHGIDVHLFHFNPCGVLWDDIVDERTMARWIRETPERALLSDIGHPLLASWGKLGRDGLRLLLEADAGEGDGIEDCFVDPVGDGVLGQIQRDILYLQSPDPERPRPLEAQDGSLLFTQAASPLREVEALHDHLLHLFETLPALEPRDVVVMAPDVDVYAPYIRAVFNEPRGSAMFIPFTIADRPGMTANPLMGAIFELLRLPERELAVSDLLGWLSVPALAQRFDLDPAPVTQWLRVSGARRGLAGSGQRMAPANTLEAGLQRLLLGVAMEQDAVWDATTSVAAAVGHEAPQLGRLISFVRALDEQRQALLATRDILEWCAAVTTLLERFVAQDDAEVESALAGLRHTLLALPDRLGQSGFDQPLERAVFLKVLEQELTTVEGGHRFLRGAVTVSTLTPLRSIPHRVVCILGLNADAYPRVQRPPAFDLMARDPRVGDRSRRDDDRQLFLEALLSARDCLYLSRIGIDERDNSAREASVLVSELRDHIDRYWHTPSGKASAQLTRQHPLKPFDQRYFNGEADLFSYRRQWCLALKEEHREALQEVPLPALPANDPVEWATFLRVVANPCDGFFAHRLGVYFPDTEVPSEDLEPFVIDGLAGWSLRHELLSALLVGEAPQQVYERCRARGQLPHGYVGERQYARAQRDAVALSAYLEPWRERPVRSVAIDLTVAGRRLLGTLARVRGDAILYWTASSLKTSHVLEFWLHHLVGCALGELRGVSHLYAREHRFSAAVLPAELACAQLDEWMGRYESAMCSPQPVFQKATLAFAERLVFGKNPDPDAARAAALSAFEGRYQSPGDGASAAVGRVWRDATQAIDDRFEDCARGWLVPVLEQVEKFA